jgi:hypothetical protein
MLDELLLKLAVIDPGAAAVGAGVLFLFQLLVGGKLPDVGGLLRKLFGKKDAVPTPAVPAVPTPAVDPLDDNPLLKFGRDFLKARLDRVLKNRVAASLDPLEELTKLNKLVGELDVK